MPTPTPPLRVTFFGDSIFVGQGVSIHHGWVTQVAGLIDEVARVATREVVVTNASVNGNTTRQALERMAYEVQSQGVDILLVQFGLNDCNYWESDKGLPRVSPAAFAANLEEIIARAVNFGARKVFLNTNHPTTRTTEVIPNTGITFEESNSTYNEVIRSVAKACDTRVVLHDIEQKFHSHIESQGGGLEELLLADGLHLSVKGHGLYYDSIGQSLVRCVNSMLNGHE